MGSRSLSRFSFRVAFLIWMESFGPSLDCGTFQLTPVFCMVFCIVAITSYITKECHWHNDMHNQLHIDKCTAEIVHQYRMYRTRLCAQVLDQSNLRVLEACFQLNEAVYHNIILACNNYSIRRNGNQDCCNQIQTGDLTRHTGLSCCDQLTEYSS